MRSGLKRETAWRRGQATVWIVAAGACLLMVAVLWLWTRPAARPTEAVGQEIAEQFLKHLQNGQPDLAWEATTSDFKSDQGKEAFRKKIKPLKFLSTPMEFVSSQTATIGDQPRSEFVYQAKTGEQIKLVVCRDGTEWKIERWTK